MISSAKEALDENDYEKAHGFMVECKNIIEGHAKNSFEAVNAAITSLKEMEGDTSEYEKMLDNLKLLYVDKKYTEVLSISEKIVKETNEKQHKIATDIFSGASDIIQQAKDKKIWCRFDCTNTRQETPKRFIRFYNRSRSRTDW